jgi:hypothetical protein
MTQPDRTTEGARSGDRDVSSDPRKLDDIDPREFVGDAPVGDDSPGDFVSNDQSTGADEVEETTNRESHPNAGGPAGLAGDMGISSERQGPFTGIEGTGSLVSAQHTTDGESAVPPTEDETGGESAEATRREATVRDQPDETARVSNVDRTVGEVRPDPVTNKHEFDPSKNPRH